MKRRENEAENCIAPQEIHMKGDDYKARMWGRNAPSNVKIVGIDEGPKRLLIKYLFGKRKRPSAFIFRYLNDNRGFLQQAMQVVAELTLITYFKIVGVKVAWICHNVDQESTTLPPYGSRIRRAILSKVSKSVFVTSPLLIQHCREILPATSSKLSVASFGLIESSCSTSSYYGGDLKAEEVQPSDERLVLLSASIAHPKKVVEARFMLRLAKLLESNFSDARIIFAGPMVSYIMVHHAELFKEISQQSNISIINNFIDIESAYANFPRCALIKNYNDLSVPLGIHQAISRNAPIITSKGSFVGDLVREFELGVVISDFSADEIRLVSKIEPLTTDITERFFLAHSWKRGAESLSTLLHD